MKTIDLKVGEEIEIGGAVLKLMGLARSGHVRVGVNASPGVPVELGEKRMQREAAALDEWRRWAEGN